LANKSTVTACTVIFMTFPGDIRVERKQSAANSTRLKLGLRASWVKQWSLDHWILEPS
jgi:hypothetical protein